MGRPRGWAVAAAVGFVRACAVAAVTLLVPAVWAGAVALGIHWGAGNPWSWLLPLILVGTGTLALSGPVCRAVRFLVARWTGTDLPAGHRRPGPVGRLSTGYWWNGFSYERSRRDALLDQKWRIRWSDPATWRDLRFTAIAPFTAGLVAVLPPAGAAFAVLGLSGAGPAPPSVSPGCSPCCWPSARPRTRGGPSSRSPSASCARPRRWPWPTASAN
ncbi:hypothetical protein [Streptomyces laurentii]|uniref:hypothetical protein n=1 Tax=Streptomyces laurentii TaxID=39478 RepID=UPI0033F59257